MRGEITVVIAGASGPAVSLEAAAADVLARVATGERLSAAAAAVAENTGLPRKAVYDAALTARGR